MLATSNRGSWFQSLHCNRCNAAQPPTFSRISKEIGANTLKTKITLTTNCMNQMPQTTKEQKQTIFLKKLNISKLADEQNQSCEREISVEEITTKSPGNDGITIEFYNTCWELNSYGSLYGVRERVL